MRKVIGAVTIGVLQTADRAGFFNHITAPADSGVNGDSSANRENNPARNGCLEENGLLSSGGQRSKQADWLETIGYNQAANVLFKKIK